MEEQKLPRVIEVIGLAGTGKTTLAQALSQRDKRIKIGEDLELRKKRNILPFVRNFFPLLPSIVHRPKSTRWFTWDEIKFMVYLQGWSEVIRRRTNRQDKVVVLDQGPVFKFATLYGFGPESFIDRKLEDWRRRVYRQWADTLDMVIWLDAPEAVLVERINRREKRHMVKGKSELEANEFLECYRNAYKDLFGKMIADREPPVLRFDTSQKSIDEIVSKTLEALGIDGDGDFEIGLPYASIHSYQ